MKLEIVIAVLIGWFVLRTIIRTMRKNKANLQRGGQNNNNSPITSQEIIDTATQERLAIEEADSSKEGHSLEFAVDETSKRVIDPFLESTTLEDNTKSQYNEESLVEEYNRTHDQGKTVTHRKHNLFDEKKDRQKAIQHRSGIGKTKPITNEVKRAERREKRVHPIAAAMKNKGGIKQAVILTEVLKRPEQ